MLHTSNKFTLIQEPSFGQWTVAALFHTGETSQTLSRTFFYQRDAFAFITEIATKGIHLPKERKEQESTFRDYQAQLEEQAIDTAVTLCPTRPARGYKHKPLTAEESAKALASLDDIL